MLPFPCLIFLSPRKIRVTSLSYVQLVESAWEKY